MGPFARAMKDVREALGLTHEQFAQQTGLAINNVQITELLDYDPLTYASDDYLEKVSAAFGIPVSGLEMLVEVQLADDAGFYDPTRKQFYELVLTLIKTPVKKEKSADDCVQRDAEGSEGSTGPDAGGAGGAAPL
jgi:transcriptional regulator with XRE-family HTH domain